MKRAATLFLLVFGLSAVHAAVPPKIILDGKAGAEKRLLPSSPQVTATLSQDPSAPGVAITVQPGPEGYPGIALKPSGASWDLSAFGHVEARLVNTGAMPLTVSLRVDNAGDWHDNPWNTESVTLAPGQAGTVRTIFGYAYGFKPGYNLKPSSVVNLLLFTGKSDSVQSFRLESLIADGPPGETPPVAPEDIRVKPAGGDLLSGAVKDTSVPGVLTWKPALGRWDLRDFLEVRVRVQNTGLAPVTPRVRVESNGGPSEWAALPSPLAPGATREIVVPFANARPADLMQKGTENQITSDAVSAVTLAMEGSASVRSLTVESVQAALPSASIPSWLGKRPPVGGDWVPTLNEEFNGAKIDSTLWRLDGPNYYDKQTHWSKTDVVMGGGVVRLRYEKKRGFSNDDPTQPQTDYSAGYLDTYDRWVQRYGYFEARMKLPAAPGLWPAFWMMPDRGLAAGPEQWKRQDTGNGGMEFDIMEHLTRWGPHRYNIAMHYDGYGASHKSVGSDKIYVQPDKDGFLTCGLLWTPGSAVYYCNGREVLHWNSPRISNVPSILLFTLPMGGWDNSPLDDARLPSELVIDYVRVWQRKDLASEADGKKPVPLVH